MDIKDNKEFFRIADREWKGVDTQVNGHSKQMRKADSVGKKEEKIRNIF